MNPQTERIRAKIVAAQRKTARGGVVEWMRRYYQAPCLYREGQTGEDWLAEVVGADWEERWDRNEFEPNQGTLTLCDQGCGYETVIALNGPMRGRVINAYFADPPQFAPYSGIFEWYEGWLDDLLAGRAPGWFGYARRETETPQ